MEILKFLNDCTVVADFEILDFRKWETGKFLNIKIRFIDNSSLFLKEYQDEKERNYSYH